MRRLTATAITLTGLALLAHAQKPLTRGAGDDVDPDAAKTVWEYLVGRYDANKDGKISKEEYKRGETQFARLDKDKNGFIEQADTKQVGRRRGARGERKRVEPPQEGALAPDFKLETLYATAQTEDADKAARKDPAKKKTEPVDAAKKYEVIQLSALKGKKPVALIFGSYT